TSSADMAKAIACGADAVILSPLLAQAAEAGAGGFYWPAADGHPRIPRGVVGYVSPLDFDVDGIEEDNQTSLETVVYGQSNEPFGQLNLVGGLRRSMAKCGYTDLKSFQKVGLAVR